MSTTDNPDFITDFDQKLGELINAQQTYEVKLGDIETKNKEWREGLENIVKLITTKVTTIIEDFKSSKGNYTKQYKERFAKYMKTLNELISQIKTQENKLLPYKDTDEGKSFLDLIKKLDKIIEGQPNQSTGGRKKKTMKHKGGYTYSKHSKHSKKTYNSK